MDWEKFASYGPAVVRIGLALTILWFGISQLIDQTNWTGYLPAFTYSWPIAPETLVILNGIAETILGGLLLVGILIRPVCAILALHLVGIIITLGYNDVAIRDAGLMMAFIGVMLNGKDRLCLRKNV